MELSPLLKIRKVFRKTTDTKGLLWRCAKTKTARRSPSTYETFVPRDFVVTHILFFAKDAELFVFHFEFRVFLRDFDFEFVGAGEPVFCDHIGKFFRDRVHGRVAVPIDDDGARALFDALLASGMDRFERTVGAYFSHARPRAVVRLELDVEPLVKRFALVGYGTGDWNERVGRFWFTAADCDKRAGADRREKHTSVHNLYVYSW
jgi:hypothetical protein